MEQIYGVREKHLTFLNLSDTLLYKRGVYPEFGGETKSSLTSNIVKLGHNGTSDA